MCVCLSINQHQCAQYIRSSVAISIVHGLKFLCLWHRILRFLQTIQLRVRSCACRSWKRAVERCSRSCGSRPNKSRITVMASARKETSYKKCPWLPSVASIFGFHLWLPSLASICGFCRWRPLLASIRGFLGWLRSVVSVRGPGSRVSKANEKQIDWEPKILRNSRWFLSLASLGGFLRWLPSLVLALGGL